MFWQFLYEAGYGSGLNNERGGMIGVTQPRRVAVLGTARRVAHELNVQLGREVGFQVRHDRKLGEKSSIKFMTDGILLRELQVESVLIAELCLTLSYVFIHVSLNQYLTFGSVACREISCLGNILLSCSTKLTSGA